MDIKEMIKINITPIIEEKLSELIKIFSLIQDEKIEDILVARKLVDNQFIYTSFWAFTESYCCEMKNFLVKNNVDILRKNSFVYAEWDYKDYDFVKATENSKFSIKVRSCHVIQADIEAIGVNCDKLLEIYNKHIKPNF